MTAAPLQAPRLVPRDVHAAALADAFNLEEPAACLLVDVLRICFDTDEQASQALQRACFFVDKDAEADDAAGIEAEPWPLPNAVLFGRLAASIGDEIKQGRQDLRGGADRRWARYVALGHGASLLQTAATLEKRDGHLMRRQGGMRLPPSAFKGLRLRAQVVAVEPSPGQPGGQALRITWDDSAHLVVQSKPERFSERDYVEPT